MQEELYNAFLESMDDDINRYFQQYPINTIRLEVNGHEFTPLCLACLHSRVSTVKLLLSLGARVNDTCLLGEFGQGYPLHFAACSGTSDAAEKVHLLLHARQDVNLVTKSSESGLNVNALQIACMSSHPVSVAIMSVLLDHEADFKQVYGERGFRRAIHLVTMTSSEEKQNNKPDYNLSLAKIQLLVSKGEDINACEPHGFTPLFMASVDFDLFTNVINMNGIDIHKKFVRSPSDKVKKTAFHHFFEIVQEVNEDDRNAVYKILNLLIKKGAMFTVESKGVKLLHQSVSDLCVPVLKSLMNRGEDINSVTTDGGYTCVHILAKTDSDVAKSSAVLRYIGAKYNPNYNIADTRGNYAISDLVVADRADDVDFLASNGARTDITVSNKRLTLVHLAVYKGCIATLRCLVSKHKLSVNTADKDGQMPIHYLSAAHLSVVDPEGELMRILLDGGADPNAIRNTVNKQESAVHLVLAHYVPLLAKAKGFQIDALSSDGMTALHQSAASLNGQKVRALLDGGADSSIRLSQLSSEQLHGKTALDLAKEQNAQNISQKYVQQYIIKLLESRVKPPSEFGGLVMLPIDQLMRQLDEMH